jgi:hypothetical protein
MIHRPVTARQRHKIDFYVSAFYNLEEQTNEKRKGHGNTQISSKGGEKGETR